MASTSTTIQTRSSASTMASTSTTTIEIVPSSSGQASNGDHPVEKILRQGYIEHKGKTILVGVAQWENSLVKMEDVVYDEEVPFGLQGSDLNLSRAWAPEVKPRGHVCRFCSKGFSDRRNGIRHEKEACRAPGAPKHDCDVICGSSGCIGAGKWTRPRDRRYGNPLAGRPRKET